ncbi:DUF3307 domain-containing protein [Marinoscillum sp. MHG1-6]|uniref:DUF3307 domain-containing protein n=1 Tax=Marinoscillum sp. MHG1-6 TaxID=2959627 RepID=UPI0021577FDA|nr:DUF3307 domain-containing protein [Marinoscillum sp. MHG1-6]
MNLLLLKFLLAHLIGDFVLQPNKWVSKKEAKKHKSIHLYLHVLVHAVTLIILLWFDFQYWLGMLIVIFSHLLIDLAKTQLNKRVNSHLLFFGDQVAHLLIIVGAVSIYSPIDWSLSPALTSKNYLLVISIILVTYVASVIMRIIFTRWDLKENKKGSLKNAGQYIGILERLFVFSFVVMEHWEVIGFLLAAKSVFRFGDLSKSRDRKLTEYILIGTLLSFGLAIMVGMGYVYLVKQ